MTRHAVRSPRTLSSLAFVAVAALLVWSLAGPREASSLHDERAVRPMDTAAYARLVHNQALRTTLHFPLRVDQGVEALRVAVVADGADKPPMLMARVRFDGDALPAAIRQALSTRQGEVDPVWETPATIPAWRRDELQAPSPEAKQVVLESDLIDEFDRRLDRGVIIDADRREIVYWLRFHDTLGRDPSREAMD